MAKTNLDIAYTKLTGLTYSISEVINNASEEEKPVLARKIYWTIKNGIVRDGDIFKELFTAFHDNLGDFQSTFDTYADFDNDGNIDNDPDDAAILSKITVDSGSED